MIYRFGNCEVDTKLLEIRSGGEPRALDPLEFDLLVYLIENRDRVVTRDELLDALWPGRVVTDSALSSRLKAVRAAVGDTGKAQQVIRTAHGRGYRFVADLENVAPPVPATVVPSTSAVGREAEIGRLGRWLDRARGGHREIVLISGEAGVGKTTLTRAFLDAAQESSDVRVMHGQCVNQRGVAEAYLPLLEAIARAGRSDAAVVDVLKQHAPAWLVQLPSLNPDPDAHKAAVGATPGRMLREVSDALEALSALQPLILVLEDLHWSDPSTIEWLDYYARRSDNARMMLIATVRPESEQYAACRELAARDHAEHVRLDAIDESSITDYLTYRLDHPPTPALAALIFRRTSGFPLFIEALLSHWLDRGLIERSGGNWRAASSDEVLLEGVPEDLSQLIDQQLAGLEDGERRLLETAALAGSPFAAAAVAHALGEPEESVEARYGRMARQDRVVRNAGEEVWPDGTVTATFEFRHELYREALYQSIPASRRARLHAALGERLEQAYGVQAEAHAGELADHYARAHEVGRALRYFYPAALKAFNKSAYRESLSVLNRAIELIGTLPESEDALRVERELQLLRASATIVLEGWASETVEMCYGRARQIADKLGLEDRSSEVFGIASMQELRGHFKDSQRTIEGMLSGRSDLSLEGHELLACSLFHQGQFERSKRSADVAIDLYDPEQVSSVLARYGENPGVCCHGWAALDLWFMGYPDKALERSEQALKLAEEHVYSRSTALTYRSLLHQFNNEPEEAARWAAKTIEVAGAQGFMFRVAQTSVISGWARARLADDDEARRAALEQMDAGIAAHRAFGAAMDMPYYLTLKAEVLSLLGDTEAALGVIDEALAAADESRAFFYEPEMHRRRALLLLELEPPDDEGARAAIEQSLAIARRRGARMLELRTAVTRLETTEASPDETLLEELRTLVSGFSEGAATPDLQAAAAFS